MKVKKLAIHKLRNDEHFQLLTELNDLITRIGAETIKIKPLFDTFLLLYRKVDEALKKITKSILTEQIQNKDKARDEIWYGLVEAVRAALRHFNPEVRHSAKKLKIVIDTYGNVAKKSFNAQTSAIYNILQDLTGKYSADVTKVGLVPWITELQNHNSEFDTLMKERYDETAAQSDVVLKEARAEINKVYTAIIDCINAFIMLEGEANYVEFVKTWNAVIVKYKGRKHNAGSSEPDSEEEIPEDSDSDDDILEDTP